MRIGSSSMNMLQLCSSMACACSGSIATQVTLAWRAGEGVGVKYVLIGSGVRNESEIGSRSHPLECILGNYRHYSMMVIPLAQNLFFDNLVFS